MSELLDTRKPAKGALCEHCNEFHGFDEPATLGVWDGETWAQLCDGCYTEYADSVHAIEEMYGYC